MLKNFVGGTCIAFVGNNNSGKTSLFNALTGTNQHVANYGGVTLNCTKGSFFDNFGKKHTCLDLPGAYSLVSRTQEEIKLRDLLLVQKDNRPDALICVVDANCLERSLYFASQVLECNIPSIVVLTKTDIFKRNKHEINERELSKFLGGVSVISVNPFSSVDVRKLRSFLTKAPFKKPKPEWLKDFLEELPKELQELCTEVSQSLNLSPEKAILILSQDREFLQSNFNVHYDFLESKKTILEEHEEVYIQGRYKWLEKINEKIFIKRACENTFDLDKCLLHPVFGVLFFVSLMLACFALVFSFGEGITYFLEKLFKSIGSFASNVLPEGWIRDWVGEGVLGGVMNLVFFLPPLLILTLFMEVLGQSGYLTRVSFLFDNIMRRLGFSGRSLISFLNAYVCTVPALLSARSCRSVKEKWMLMLTVSCFSCSGRLPIYLFLISVMFTGASMWLKTAALAAIYFIGSFFGLGVAYFLKKFVFTKKDKNKLEQNWQLDAMELPPLHLPNYRSLIISTLGKGISFLKNIGTIVLLFSLIFWWALHFPSKNADGTKILDKKELVRNSYGAKVGRILEPALMPLGYDWKIGVGLLAAFGAREHFISTLSLVEHTYQNGKEISLRKSWSNDIKQTKFYTNNLNASEKEKLLSKANERERIKKMRAKCLSLIVFFLFSLQCVGSMACLAHLAGSWWFAVLQYLVAGCVAYVLAFFAYRIGLIIF